MFTSRSKRRELYEEMITPPNEEKEPEPNPVCHQPIPFPEYDLHKSRGENASIKLKAAIESRASKNTIWAQLDYVLDGEDCKHLATHLYYLDESVESLRHSKIAEERLERSLNDERYYRAEDNSRLQAQLNTERESHHRDKEEWSALKKSLDEQNIKKDLDLKSLEEALKEQKEIVSKLEKKFQENESLLNESKQKVSALTETLRDVERQRGDFYTDKTNLSSRLDTALNKISELEKDKEALQRSSTNTVTQWQPSGSNQTSEILELLKNELIAERAERQLLTQKFLELQASYMRGARTTQTIEPAIPSQPRLGTKMIPNFNIIPRLDER
ncbi:MAG: hypothetical protein K0S74_215 [Chlamydiales bacterium]|jgi:chromosome segregation ATPase|nr:hypothetical protein [Chlamydiales bacterium]